LAVRSLRASYRVACGLRRNSILRLNDFRVMKSYFEVHEGVWPEDDIALKLTVDINGEDEQFQSSGFAGCVVVIGVFDVSACGRKGPRNASPRSCEWGCRRLILDLPVENR
jgi:hypothetical protein